ncbi:hypothetical protein KAX02_07985 [candidate division WOR-3 bacterium]|nr:hypothetical protein [candidate division WOR-3 bacterium]
MIPKNIVELVRLKVDINGNIHLPKSMRKEYGVEHKTELMIGLFEVLNHGEISQMPSFDVKFI